MNILVNSGRVTPFLETRNKLIKRIIKNEHNVTLTGFQTGYENEIEKIGASFVEMPVNRAGLNPLRDLKLVLKYFKLIKKSKIHLVHSYTIKPNIYGSIAARLAGVKQIYPTINGLGYAYTGNDFKNRIVRIVTSILYKVAFSCSTKVFFQNSDDAREMVNRHLIRPEKCVVIAGSGIDLVKFCEIEQPEKFSFIMVTRLLKSKGVYEYLEAARIVKGKYNDIEMYLVGPIDPNPNGVKEEELQAFIDEGIINYLGVSTEVHKLLGRSSVFVLPSYYREGVPHSILEAMATGRAILTTDSPGCRETVKNGINGFLVPTKDSKALSEKMIWMIENQTAVKEMGKESLIYAKERFDVKMVNEHLMSTMEI
ncbi:glycosyltransferase family 4 protein [Paenibacillus sabinae]|uniref:Group 1 glycosyl transferase n=1 Tax=Paenibacillus sabinae T27 TaxID=1268072 RepID=X5A2J9_9BACL|nr:glycosyltransferase family 4 protein [Paenibacillus sabinae]AHV98593.1 group 1 glycosyl transferase [Paenibacillus sabinae T27]